MAAMLSQQNFTMSKLYSIVFALVAIIFSNCFATASSIPVAQDTVTVIEGRAYGRELPLS